MDANEITKNAIVKMNAKGANIINDSIEYNIVYGVLYEIVQRVILAEQKLENAERLFNIERDRFYNKTK